MSGCFDLTRFADAQGPVFAQVVAELASGRKEGHWMWFVFPQIDGLGHSPTARRYAIRSLGEGRAYLEHELLGPRLHRCIDLVMRVEGRSAAAIFGSPDDMKFRSSMTLFREVDPADPAFGAALRRYFDARPDERTLELLGR